MPFFSRAAHWPDGAMLVLDQPDPYGVRDGGRLGRRVELEPNVGQIPMRSVMADEQFVCNLALTQAFRDQTEDLHLALREWCPRRASAAGAGFLQLAPRRCCFVNEAGIVV